MRSHDPAISNQPRKNEHLLEFGHPIHHDPDSYDFLHGLERSHHGLEEGTAAHRVLEIFPDKGRPHIADETRVHEKGYSFMTPATWKSRE